jgi:hypothetical protein
MLSILIQILGNFRCVLSYKLTGARRVGSRWGVGWLCCSYAKLSRCAAEILERIRQAARSRALQRHDIDGAASRPTAFFRRPV